MGLAPAQQPQPASTKKDKSRELTAALRNACASVHSSVCAGGQLGSTTLSPQAPRRRWHPTPSTCSGGDPQHCFGPSMTVLGQGIPCSSLALHMPGSCRWTGCPCLAMLQLLFLAGDQAPRSHDSIRLGLAKYTAHPSTMPCQAGVKHYSSVGHT